MSTNKIILGFLGGAAAGALLGVLFAPQSGKKTRAKIARKAGRAKDDLMEQGQEGWDKLKNKAADVASMTKEELENVVHFLMKSAGSTGDHLKAAAQDLANGEGSRTRK